MRLLIVSHYFESHRGGIEIVAGHLVRGFAQSGHQVTWLATAVTAPPAASADFAVVGIRAFNALERYLGLPIPIPTPFAFRKIWREVHRADAVLVHDALYPTSFVAVSFAHLAKKPVVLVGHVGNVPYRNPFLRWLMRLGNAALVRPILARVDRVAFVSRVTRQHFADVQFRSPPAIVFNGVDTAVFRPLAETESQAELRSALSLPQDRRVVLFVGRFVEKKGLDVIRQAAALRPEFQWALAGWGPIDPTAWGSPNVIVFSELEGDSLAGLYRASDVFALPSRGEGFPLVVQEALACGLPVICSAEIAAVDEAVAPFLSPVAIENGDPLKSAVALCHAVDMAALRKGEKFSAAARFSFVSARYSWTACTARYLELIHDAAAENTSGDLERIVLRASTEPQK